MKKKCVKCNKLLPYNMFHPANKGKLKLQGNCKSCSKEITKNWQSKNKEKISKYGYEYNRSVKGRYLASKRAAKKRKLHFDLTIEEYEELLKDCCFYCAGMFPATEAGIGLDRIDSNKHYYYDNLVPCCTTCNKIKNNFLTMEETLVAIQAIKKLRLDNNTP